MAVHKHAAMKKPRRLHSHSSSGPVSIEHVHELAMECALFLAGGDRRRIRVLDQRTVIVRNSR